MHVTKTETYISNVLCVDSEKCITMGTSIWAELEYRLHMENIALRGKGQSKGCN